MANQRVMGALLARNAALSAGAAPAEASRAAMIGTMFANPIAGALVGRALARKGDVAQPPDGGDDGGGKLPAPPVAAEQPLAGAIDELADSVGALAGSVEKSAAAVEALAKAGQTASQPDLTKITVEKAAMPNPGPGGQRKS